MVSMNNGLHNRSLLLAISSHCQFLYDGSLKPKEYVNDLSFCLALIVIPRDPAKGILSDVHSVNPEIEQ